MAQNASVGRKVAPYDFVMRSLWPDIGALEIPLSKLQEVCDELAAVVCACGFSGPGAFNYPQGIVSSAYLPEG